MPLTLFQKCSTYSAIPFLFFELFNKNYRKLLTKASIMFIFIHFNFKFYLSAEHKKKKVEGKNIYNHIHK